MVILSKILIREETPQPLAAVALRVSLVLALGTVASLSPSMPALGHNYEYVKAMDVSDLPAEHEVVGTGAKGLSGTSAGADAGASTNKGADSDGALPHEPASGDPAAEDEAKTSGETAPADEGAVREDAGSAAGVESAEGAQGAQGAQAAQHAQEGAVALEALSLAEDDAEISLMAGGTVSVNSQASFASALESLGGQGTISISSSFTVSSPVSIPASANITIKLNGSTITGTASSVLDVGDNASLTVTGPGTIRSTAKESHVFSASSHVRSLSLNGSARFLADGNVFNDIAWFSSTFITPGCAFSGTQGLLAFKDDGQEIVYSNGEYVLRNWPDPNTEVWYARTLFVFFPTEADYESYVHQFGSTDISMPTIKHTVIFKVTNPDRVIGRDEILQGHCFDSKVGAEGDSAPTNAQMQAMAPKNTTFKGWLDSSGKLYTIEQIKALPVMADLVYTAKFEENPVGPVDPKPVDPVPVDPDPVGPVGPVTPDVPVGSGQELVDGSDIGAGNAIYGSDAAGLRMPQNPLTPWNPPGLATAAGFTVPASGPGVVTMDEPQLVTSAAGSGDGDGDDAIDGASPFDAKALDTGLLLTTDDVARTLGLAGGTVLAAFLVSRVQMFLNANAASTLKRPRRLRKQQPAT